VGLAVSIVTCPSAPSMGAGCPPVALVDGSAEIARPVSMLLTQHGVGAGPSSCGARVIHASLTKNAFTQAYSLHIIDGYGRASDRQVADLKDAASLIESWALQEDTDVLLPPPEAAPLVTAETTAPDPSPSEGPWRLLAAAEISRASDGSTWYGAAATGCVRTVVACVGARGRVAREGDRTVFFADLNRTSADLSGVAAAAFSFGRLTVGPMIGAGVRWTRSNVTASPVATAPPWAFSADDFGIHAEAAAVVGVGLARRWSVVAEIGGSAGILVGTRANDRTAPLLPVGGVAPPTAVPPLPPGADVHVALGCQFRP
jgi:hypothetical protein